MDDVPVIYLTDKFSKNTKKNKSVTYVVIINPYVSCIDITKIAVQVVNCDPRNNPPIGVHKSNVLDMDAFDDFCPVVVAVTVIMRRPT